jgi:hypothetical protein
LTTFKKFTKADELDKILKTAMSRLSNSPHILQILTIVADRCCEKKDFEDALSHINRA